MASATLKVLTRTGGKEYDSTLDWLKDVAEKDLPLILPAVALDEYNAMKAAGRPPSNILVDGRPATPSLISTAKRRVQLFFLDVEMLARAVAMAYDEIRKLYTRATGHAAGTIEVWGRSERGGAARHERLGGIGAVRAYLEKNRQASTYVRLIGPTVPYRRALYYSTPGTKASFKNISRHSQKRLGELEASGARARYVKGKRGNALLQVASRANVSEVVTRRLASSFGRSLYVSARWIAVPVPPWKGVRKRVQGVPALSIGWRLKGAQ